MSSERADRLRRLCEALRELTSDQVGWVEAVVQQFRRPAEFRRLPASDIINDCVLQDFGDALRIHHCFSREPFTKDKFEFALERVVNLCGMSAALAPKGNPGHDITLNGIRFSLETQADRGMRSSHLHSIPRHRRPISLETAPTVPDPKKGSRIIPSITNNNLDVFSAADS